MLKEEEAFESKKGERTWKSEREMYWTKKGMRGVGRGRGRGRNMERGRYRLQSRAPCKEISLYMDMDTLTLWTIL